MINYESSTFIARPAEHVFAYVADVRNDRHWHKPGGTRPQRKAIDQLRCLFVPQRVGHFDGFATWSVRPRRFLCHMKILSPPWARRAQRSTNLPA